MKEFLDLYPDHGPDAGTGPRSRSRKRLGSEIYDELDRIRTEFVGPVDYAAVLESLGAALDTDTEPGEPRSARD